MTKKPEPRECTARLDALLDRAAAGGGIVVLTGAGISAESGIPTFRGEAGYWRIGSVNHHPHELATRAAFGRMPEAIWSWYLYRRGVCLAARPNAAHLALARLEQRLGERFTLVTQNVDGLHLRAGNSLDRTWQIHGNIEFVRCAAECDGRIEPMPDGVPRHFAKGTALDARTAELLHCEHCGAWRRPHVLWLDEFYDEARYRFDSSLRAAAAASVLIVVGTSGATNLPTQMVLAATRRQIPLLVVGRDESPFSELGEASPGGLFLEGRAGELVPEIVERLLHRGAP